MDTLHTQELDAYLFSGYWVALAVTIVLVVGAAAFHYEMFRLLTRLHGTHRLRIFYLMLSLILVHMLEIGLFGVGYYLLHATGSGDVMIFAHPSGGDVMHV
ncbi:MAG: hypothetical protein U9Q71_01205, partial [Pseudomonadota bacterium]|nr:hypothetical protein [Pseudomonadota bacterium]